MDPDATLEIIREVARRINEEGADMDGQDAEELAQAIDDLDTWITKGGFLPRAWRREPV